jgi:hypothetical protein
MSTITITIQDDKENVGTRLKKSLGESEVTSKVKDMVSPKVVEMMNLLKKRLDRQSEPVGGA